MEILVIEKIGEKHYFFIDIVRQNDQNLFDANLNTFQENIIYKFLKYYLSF